VVGDHRADSARQGSVVHERIKGCACVLERRQPTEFASAVTDIDAELQRKIDQLTEYRRRIAELASGESLVLPPEVVAILNRLRSLGVSERRVRLERDAWILMQALDLRAVPQRIREKNASFDDPETTRLYLACDQSVDWDTPRTLTLLPDGTALPTGPCRKSEGASAVTTTSSAAWSS
jgi:hypothetical protein